VDGYLPHHWVIACASATLTDRPHAVTIQDVPLVLFRNGDGVAHALLDRWPHRNVPLSAGRVVAGTLKCGYHGWRFGGDGACRVVPALEGETDRKARRAVAHATAEHDGFVWVYSTPDVAPVRPPYRFPAEPPLSDAVPPAPLLP
jgi:phenylpropionate dioxygenase-like ring-hydroxylating dioxygenase large terminal subunit